jgi:hypothetical protein
MSSVAASQRSTACGKHHQPKLPQWNDCIAKNIDGVVLEKREIIQEKAESKTS